MRTPEGKIKDKVKHILKANGCYQFWPVQMGLGARTLDCLVCHYGRFIIIETKRPGGKLTPIQDTIARQVIEAGGTFMRVSNDVELGALVSLLNSITISHANRLSLNAFI